MTSFKAFKANELFSVHSNPQLDKRYFNFSQNGRYPYFTRTVLNNGIAGYVDYLDDEHLTKGGVLAVGMLGLKFFYVDRDFYSGQFTKHIRPKGFVLTRRTALYFKTIFDKSTAIYQGGLVRDFANLFNNTDVELPIDEDGKIDFSYMENRVRELEAERIRELETYLKATGLSDYILTPAEQSVVAEFRERERERESRLTPFRIGDLFANIQQGSRLTKNNQLTGSLAFIMSGTTNTGLVGHISNPVPTFPKNSITVDIFGNVFYRDYIFAASDDVGVLWNDDNHFNSYHMLYLASAIKVSLAGMFDYGRKLRISQVKPYKVYLPVDLNGQLNLDFMELFIRAQQKLTIKNVVEWHAKYISAVRDACAA